MTEMHRVGLGARDPVCRGPGQELQPGPYRPGSGRHAGHGVGALLPRLPQARCAQQHRGGPEGHGARDHQAPVPAARW
jgi:hypothetical protein